MTMRPDLSRLALVLALATTTTSIAACGESDSDDGAASAADTDAGESTDTEDDSPESTTPDDASAASSDGGDDGEDDTSGDDGSTVSDTSGDDPDTSTDTGEPVDQLPPMSADMLLPWLQDSRYAAWSAESGVHPSAGPHGGGVRTFVNDALFDSLAAGDATHPEGAAVVKELYNGDALNGWAVMLKVTPEAGGSSWYWYEIIGANVVADGIDVGLCSGCHSSATDYVLTPFPLQ